MHRIMTSVGGACMRSFHKASQFKKEVNSAGKNVYQLFVGEIRRVCAFMYLVVRWTFYFMNL